MGEFELIRQFFAAAPCARAGGEVALGIGDDCALLDVPAGHQLAISTDTLVAGVHFPEQPDPFLLGQRALAVAASDLAAMGATPVGFTLALTLPTVDPEWLRLFAQGLNRMAEGCTLRLIGGDTTRGPLSITVSVFGRVPAGRALTRSGAQAGDLLCVGGPLGDAAGALPLVLGQQQADAKLADPLLARYWAPQPQLALGQALLERATAAMDISDGLLADAGHIAKASGVAVNVLRDALPLSAALLAFAGLPGARACALAGGDDYVLLFSVPAAELPALLAEGWPVSVIGNVSEGQGVYLLDEQGLPLDVDRRGYEHF